MAGKRAAGEGSARLRPDGRWVARQSVGPRGSSKVYYGYGRTRADAFTDLRRKIKQASRDHDLNAVPRWRMDQFLDWWVSEELSGRVADGTMASTTAKSYAQACRLHLKPMLGDVRLVEIRAVHVRRMLDTARRRGLSPRHRNYLHTVLSAALGCAVRYEMIEVVNPASLVEPPKRAKQRRDGTPADHALKLLTAAQGDRLEAYWRVMLSAPLRPGEPRAMVWDDVDLDAGTYRVRRNLVRIEGRWEFHDCKGHQERTIPLGAATVAALRRRKVELARERLAAGVGWKGAAVVDVDGSAIRPELVFCNEDGSPIHQTWIARELERLCTRAEIPRMTPHSLRHAANTLLQAQGVTPAVIQQLAGHATPAMTDHYTGVLGPAMRDAVDRLADVIQP